MTSAARLLPPRVSRNGGTWRTIASCLVSSCAALAVGCGGSTRTGAGVQAGHATLTTAAATVACIRVQAARYLAIAQAGNRRLERDFDALAGRDRDDLAAARADLQDIAATERLFDRRLTGIAFPPQTEKTARQLTLANQARARLTQTAASATSLRQLHRFLPRLERANGPVEAAVQLIRSQLGLPPPETS